MQSAREANAGATTEQKCAPCCAQIVAGKYLIAIVAFQKTIFLNVFVKESTSVRQPAFSTACTSNQVTVLLARVEKVVERLDILSMRRIVVRDLAQASWGSSKEKG
jgi:hypothetical protein